MAMKLIPRSRTKKVIAFHSRHGRMNNNTRFFDHIYGMPSTAHIHLHLCMNNNIRLNHSCTYLQLLHTCITKTALSEGEEIFTHRGFTSIRLTLFQNKLINMYAKCGSLVDARKIFDNMTERDVFSWNAILAAYQRHGHPEEALAIFYQMRQTETEPDHFTFATILPACARMRALEEGTDIHQSIIEKGFLLDVVVVNALIDMYAKCGGVQKACALFDKMSQRDAVSWNSMIAGYAQNGFLDEALRLFKGMPQRDVVSWTAMIAGYVQNGLVEKALKTFKQMQLAGVKPNSATFSSILPACAKMGALSDGRGIHQSIIGSGFLSNVVVASALLDMYAKCGSIHKAQELFDKMAQRNVVSWTAMIGGYSQNGLVQKALWLFMQMQLSGVKPKSTTFASIVPSCAKIGALEHGMEFHRRIIESGFLPDVVIVNTLIDMYAKCGSIHKARELFDKLSQQDVVSWNTMIGGYAQNGLFENALETFKQMQLAGVKSDSTTFASILTACAKMGALKEGMDIHQNIMENRFLTDVVVASALIDLYVKCGSIQKARKLFDKMPQRNVVSWTAMIAGYAQNGVLDEALRLFKKMPRRDVVSWTVMVAGYAQNGLVEKALETFRLMQLAGVTPNSTTFVSVLPACARLGALEQGMEFHQRIIESGFLSDVVVNSLIDMYAKCGSIHKAHELFEKMSVRDAVSWNAMIAGYAMHGYGKDALDLFKIMKHSRTYPDQISFICVLFACSHAGLVDEGCKYFNGMRVSYCVMPTMDHYVCMVDLLGRALYLEEALNFIVKMPIKPAVVVWKCLLGACRSHKNIRLGVPTATLLFELDPKNPASYALLSDIYAEEGRWGDVQKVRGLMKVRGIKKCLDVVGLKSIK